MRFWRKKAHRVLVVGIFQSVGTGRAVLQNLHRARFRRAAAIHASAKGRQRVEEQGISAIGGAGAGFVLSPAPWGFFFWGGGAVGDYPPSAFVLVLAALAVG